MQLGSWLVKWRDKGASRQPLHGLADVPEQHTARLLVSKVCWAAAWLGGVLLLPGCSLSPTRGPQLASKARLQRGERRASALRTGSPPHSAVCSCSQQGAETLMSCCEALASIYRANQMLGRHCETHRSGWCGKQYCTGMKSAQRQAPRKGEANIRAAAPAGRQRRVGRMSCR